jgi:hypothetical protein
MTILVGARNRRALVLGADSQESNQVARVSTQKLLMPRAGLVLAWAGYKDVAQALYLSLREDPLDLSRPRSKIAHEARERFRVIRSDPDIEHRSDGNEFLLGWFCRAESMPVALHLRMQGSFGWTERWQYAGNQSAIQTANAAQSCLNYIPTENLPAEQLALVALKVLRDSISVAPSSALVGGEPQLATVTADGARILRPKDIRAANHTLDLWEVQSADLLVGGAEVPDDSEQVDRGLEPPT